MSNEILEKRLNVEVPPRCGRHECVKSAYDPVRPYRSCIHCNHYHLSYTCKTCLECLATEELCNFSVRKDDMEEEWYRYKIAATEEAIRNSTPEAESSKERTGE